VQDEALTVREAEADAPLLPADLVAFDLEARALRLVDVERLDVRALVRDQVGRVIRVLLRDRHEAVVLDPDDFAAVEVVDRDDTFDWVRIGVVAGVARRPREGARQPARAVLLEAEVAVGPAVDEDERHVREAAFGQRGDVVRVLPDRLGRFEELGAGHARLDARDLLAGDERALRE
jgi:hypothetical protein